MDKPDVKIEVSILDLKIKKQCIETINIAGNDYEKFCDNLLLSNTDLFIQLLDTNGFWNSQKDGGIIDKIAIIREPKPNPNPNTWLDVYEHPIPDNSVILIKDKSDGYELICRYTIEPNEYGFIGCARVIYTVENKYLRIGFSVHENPKASQFLQYKLLYQPLNEKNR